jgi:hypothetical protein
MCYAKNLRSKIQLIASGLMKIPCYLALLCLAVTTVFSQTVQWTNGHYYQIVKMVAPCNPGITYLDASTMATNLGGYLATLTSAREDAFVYSLISTNIQVWTPGFNTDLFGPWIGGFQPPNSPEPAGGWQWETGEPFVYTNWETGEPNNNNGNESRLQFYSQTTSVRDRWNDSAPGNLYVKSFVVEYDHSPFNLIDFEVFPDGTIPCQLTSVSNQYQQAFHVDFQLQNGSFPLIARNNGGGHNNHGIAFTGPNNALDTPAYGQNMGERFLGCDGTNYPIIITYSEPTAAASGIMADIESEVCTVEALGNLDQVLKTLTIAGFGTNKNAGDGIASPWSFQRPAADVYKIRISNITLPLGAQMGWALDNFAPRNAIPSPAPPVLGIHRTNGSLLLDLIGTPGALYRIETNSSLAGTWRTVTNFYLTASPSSIMAQTIGTNSARFYRAIGIEPAR